MESSSVSSCVRILRESHVLLLKNRCLMASIALLILLLHSFLMICNYFFVKAWTKDFVMEETKLFFTNPETSQASNLVSALTADLHIFFGFELFFILAFSMASLFSSAITVLASAVTYGEGNLSLIDLLSRVFKSCKRPITTWFYISLFDLGYILLAFFLFLPFMIKFGSTFHPTTLFYVMMIPVLVFRVYLAVVWNMAIVISVVEEKGGVEAIGKASQILKGLKAQGFVLNLVFEVVAWIVSIWWHIKSEKKGTYDSPVTSLILLNIIWVIRMLQMVGFAVFYHMCKQSHGEEVELQGISEYTKVPSQPLIGAVMA